ncbi:PAQR family membrane homeostasis protein TrhA [Lujinxingia vulgaris]|nr:hemolysin III family protein [Lujinxingia vulgaris]
MSTNPYDRNTMGVKVGRESKQGESQLEELADKISDARERIAHTEIFSAEDIANSVSHGVGLGAAIVGFVVLMVSAWATGVALQIVSALVYGLTLVALFAASTIYHSVTQPRVRRALQVLDHCAVFFLIAGTYTPFALVTLQGTLGWTIMGVIWSLALLGVTIKLFWFGRFEGLSLALYLLMGWTIVFAIKPLWLALEPGGVFLLFGGGLFYTAGVAFFVWERLFLNHAIWHLFVLGGSVCHFLAILFYVLG